MNGNSELVTVQQYWKRWSDPRFIVMVLVNHDLNQVTWEQRVLAGDPKFSAAQDVIDFPYARYAEMLGFEGIRVDRPDDVAPGWDRALSSRRPVLIEFVADPNVPPLPPHITFEQAQAYVASLLKGEPTLIRNPQATRPWQHVLEPLNGYLTLAEHLWDGKHRYASGWNFGPPEESERTVGWIIGRLYDLWGVEFEWKRDADPGPPESTFLKLDASKARAHLQWRPKLDLDHTLAWIVDWTRAYQKGADMRDVTLADIDRFAAIVPKV